MTKRDLKKLFDESTPHPDADAKQRSIMAAMDEFENATSGATASQGSGVAGRPISTLNDIWRRWMQTIEQKWLLGAAGSAVAVVLGVTLTLNQPGTNVSVPIAGGKDSEFLDLVRGTPAPGETRVTGERPQIEEFEAFDVARVRHQTAELKKETGRVLASNDSRGEEEQFRKIPMKAKTLAEPVLAESLAGTSRAAPMVAEADMMVPPGYQDVGRDRFEVIDTNPVKLVGEEPVSTFSIDVDTAAYSFVRRQLNQGVLPQKDAVRLEEMVNYFPYEYPDSESRTAPFTVSTDVVASPWQAGNKLVRVGIKGFDMSEPLRSNIVFLLDVSGSMNSPNKLPLVKQSMSLLLDQLQPEDTVAIAVYAGAAGMVLEPTKASEKQKILAAMGRLNAGGSTAGAAGIKLAYELAEANFIEDGVNRVILATDGDFNVGITSRDELKGFIERKRDAGIYLSVLGFGQGNYHDAMMQQLAQNGNGVAAYIDTLGEAQKVLVDEATSTLFPIAGDVKIQVEFNPAAVKEYRLLGYESRMLNREDFNNDAVDAGEIGAGHRVTAIYEITPADGKGLIDPLRYGNQAQAASSFDNEVGFIKFRYKLPGEKTSRLISQPIPGEGVSTDDLQRQETMFAVAVAGFAQLLRGGEYTGDWTYDDALQLAIANKGDDVFGYRAELTQLIRKAMSASAM